MRDLALLAAIVMMHTAHALPRPGLAVHQGRDDLSNDSHVFHHLDRNQRTAGRDHERMYRVSAEGPELYVAKRLPESDRPQRAGWRTMTEERRFIQDPDYSQGGSRGGSNSASPATNTNTTATQQRPLDGKNREQQPTAMGDPERKSRT